MTTDPAPSAQGRIAGVTHAPLPPDRVLGHMQTPSILNHCIPGARSVEADDQGRFALHIEGSVGPFEARIDGILAVAVAPDGRRCRLTADGRGGDASAGVIDLGVTLDPTEDGCRVVYDGTITVTGNAAAVGDRIVETMANMLGRLFFERLLTPTETPTDTVTDTPAETVASTAAEVAAAAPLEDAPIPPRLGLNPQVWVPGLCITLLMLVLVFRL